MKLKIVKCPEKNFKPYVKKAALFFAKELITNGRIRNNCNIVIKFNSKIKDYGFAIVEDYNSKKEPRSFSIEVHPGIGARRILETIAHEMVHVKQFIEGETDDTLSTWRGKKVNSEKVDYWVQPWEIDAHGREVGLLTKFAIQECLWEIFEEFRNPALPIVSSPIKWKEF